MTENTSSVDNNVFVASGGVGSASLSRSTNIPLKTAQMSVSELGWRGFQFFDKSFICDPKEPLKKFYGFKGLSIKKWRASPNKPFTIVGGEGGVIFKINLNLEVNFWKAYNCELIDLDLADSSKQSFVVTIGNDDVASSSVFMLWDIDQWDKQAPTRRICVKASHGLKSAAQTAAAVAISQKQNLVAVGFADTAVSFCHGDLTSDKTYRWKNLREGNNNCNEGALLGLSAADAGDGKSVIYVVCESSVQSFVLNGNVLIKTVVHDARGALPNCWRFNNITNQLIVANNDMVYFYDVSTCMDESARCHALGRGAKKLQLLCASYYLALVTEFKPPIPSTSCMLNVYDVECRYVASTFPMGNTQFFALRSDIYGINEDGSLSKYSEKPMVARLDIVIKKNLYDIAIALAKREKSTELSTIYFKYANYLYKRGDFSNSVQQYVETIGHLEPSFVITRFLEGTRSAHLGFYLEALHKRKLANENHILLLLGAYLKAGDEVKVLNFVETGKTIPSLDVDEAVKLLRAAGKYRLGVQLASMNNRNLLTFSILVEDLKDFDEAIRRLKTVSGKHLFEVLDAYGLTLLEHKEKEVIEHVSNAVQSDNVDMTVLVKLLNNYPQYLQVMYNVAHDKVKANLLFRNSILESCLERFKIDKPTDMNQFRDFILSLVNKDNFKVALRLAKLHNYSPLVIYILQQTNNKLALANYLIREGGIDDIIEVCDEKMIREMWIELINFVSKNKDIDENYVISLLRKLTATKYVHPLMVTKILAQNQDLTLASVKEYLQNWLADQIAEIKKNTEKIEKKVQKTAEIEKEICQLNEDVQIFQASKCVVCLNELTIPAVYFACKHSFHVHCYESFSDQQDLCAFCANANASDSDSDSTPKTIQLSERPSITIDDLKREIEACGNTMAVIADFIARGAFDDDKSSTLESELVPRHKPEVKLHLPTSTNPFESGIPEPEPKILKVNKKEPVSTNPFKSTNPFDNDE